MTIWVNNFMKTSIDCYFWKEIQLILRSGLELFYLLFDYPIRIYFLINPGISQWPSIYTRQNGFRLENPQQVHHLDTVPLRKVHKDFISNRPNCCDKVCQVTSIESSAHRTCLPATMISTPNFKILSLVHFPSKSKETFKIVTTFANDKESTHLGDLLRCLATAKCW